MEPSGLHGVRLLFLVERNDLMLRFVLFALLISSEANAGWFNYDNYEDCMLGRMKGQDRTMLSTAMKACKKEFKVEDEISYLGRDMTRTWSYNQNSRDIKITDNTTDYNVTKGQFSFSAKACEESKESDFEQTQTVELSGSPFIVFLYPAPLCMKTLRLWGKYK